MRRRTLLEQSAAVGTVALAGCLANGDGGPAGTPTDEPTPSVGEATVETVGARCAGADDGESASVTFDDGGPTVTLEGTLRAPNPCHHASLEGASYDGDADELTVTVIAEDDGDGMCQQCIGAVGYTATVPLEGGLPGAVVVVHGTGENGTEVARAEP